MSAPAGRYGETVFGGESDVERRRLQVMGDVADRPTRELLQRLGIAPGWRCWEIGAGCGTIPAWMAGEVTHGGHVLASDIDTSVLDHAAVTGVTVARHDVVRDPCPEGSFDLIHSRFVLEHLPEREHVLDRLVDALDSGGVLVIESIAEFPIASSPHGPFREAMRGIERVLAEAIGTDSHWARSFPSPLQRRGLVDVGTQVILPTTGGRNVSAECWSLTLQQLRRQILARGLCSLNAIDEALNLLNNPDFFDYSFATIACWGRHP